jgi:hypothetical protein
MWFPRYWRLKGIIIRVWFFRCASVDLSRRLMQRSWHSLRNHKPFSQTLELTTCLNPSSSDTAPLKFGIA